MHFNGFKKTQPTTMASLRAKEGQNDILQINLIL